MSSSTLPTPVSPAPIPPRTRRVPWVLLVTVVLATSAATRLVLLAMSGAVRADRARDVATALVVGEWYDVLVALWFALPIFLLLAIVPRRRIATRLVRGAVWTLLALGIWLALFTAAAELEFFDEFNGRFNFVAVDYLLFPTEVVTNVWQSYHVAWMLGAIGVAAVALLVLLRRRIGLALGARPPRRTRMLAVAVYAVALAAITVATTPTFARVSDDRVLNEVAASGYYTFWNALRGQDAPYDGLYATRPDRMVFARLRRLLAEPATGALVPALGSERHVKALRPAQRMNVVVVLEESFGSTLVGALHPRDSASITPRFDSLAREGLLLTNAYATGNRTIRALEATTSSLPPLPGISIVRRPQSTGLFTLPAVLRKEGYQTTFVYGGRAMFDGMGGYLRHNGVERVIDQGDFPAGTFTTAWGAADEAIFDRALAAMDTLQATGRPFYTLILTVSNHKPYTYPAGRIPQDPRERRRTFAVHYADWALGRFMRDAQRHAFFDNTLFVLMGDHGARVYGAAEIPLPSYEVPVVFYAPAHPELAPPGTRVGTLASSLDIPPTILALLGLSYDSKFFGHDVLHIDPADGRALMTHNSEIALMQGSRLAVLGLRGTAQEYHRDGTGAMHLVTSPDSAGQALIEDAIAYYQAADRLYRNGAYRFNAGVRKDELR
jgi:phosphoglycerol transferase MdoB-like AlkP superfamily enzyme